MNNPSANNGARVLQFLLIETGTYEDAMLRPYTTNVSNEANTIGLLQESTMNGQIVTAAALSDVAGRILTQQTEAEGICAIPNTWSERRLRFFMEIESGATDLTRQRQILTGYTDYSGLSNLTGAQVHFDPRMRLYFNNTISLRDSKFRAADGSYAFRSTMADDSQLLRSGSDVYANANGTFMDANNTFALRPEDLMAAQAAGVSVMQRGGGDVWDTRASFAMGVRKSSRDNGIPSRYLAKSLTALGQAYQQSDVANEPSTAVFNLAYGALREQSMHADRFFSILNNQTQYAHNGYITYQELCALVPNVDAVAQYLMPGSVTQRQESYERGRHEHWHGTGTETLFASRLCSSIPGVMIENMMTRIGFTTSNRTVDGRFALQFFEGAVGSFTQGIDMQPFLARFETTVVLEVLNTLTSNNLIDIDIDMVIDLLGETQVSISIAGAPKVHFTQPTFCDALFAPVMTINAQFVNNIGEDLHTLTTFMDTPAPQFGLGQNNPSFF